MGTVLLLSLVLYKLEKSETGIFCPAALLSIKSSFSCHSVWETPERTVALGTPNLKHLSYSSTSASS